MGNIVELDKEGFLNITKNKKRLLKSVIYSCYKDLFDENYSGAYIRLSVFTETGLDITRDITYNIKRDKDNIRCLFKAKWRDTSNSLQKGEKNEEKINLSIIKSSMVAKRGEHKLPENYQRKPHNLTQIRYHESLKNYIFDYPWCELGERGIPRPIQVGEEFEDRIQYFEDMKVYNSINDEYMMPDELSGFISRNLSLFKDYRISGFPPSRGGYHPNPIINDTI